VLRRVLELKDYSTICSSAPSEVLALAAARAWPALVARQLGTVAANVDLVRAFFLLWRGTLAWREPLAGTVAFPRLLTGGSARAGCPARLPAPGALRQPAPCALLRPTPLPPAPAGEPIDAFCERLVRDAGVLLLPATVYQHEPSVAAGHFRLGFGRASMPEALVHLGSFLERSGHRPAG
jgi:aspartate/methionine/tyrosine aminotransferase